MKKIIILAFVLFMGASTQAQDMFCSFSARTRHLAHEKIDIRLNKLFFVIAAPFLDKEYRLWLRKTNYLHLVVLEDVKKTEKTHSAFLTLCKKMQRKKYESLLTINDADSKVYIYGKTGKNDNLREIVLLVNDNDSDMVVLRVKGRFNMSDLEKLPSYFAKNIKQKTNQQKS